MRHVLAMFFNGSFHTSDIATCRAGTSARECNHCNRSHWRHIWVAHLRLASQKIEFCSDIIGLLLCRRVMMSSSATLIIINAVKNCLLLWDSRLEDYKDFISKISFHSILLQQSAITTSSNSQWAGQKGYKALTTAHDVELAQKFGVGWYACSLACHTIPAHGKSYWQWKDHSQMKALTYHLFDNWVMLW